MNKMSFNETSWCLADPWSFWGKPTGSSSRAATVEPNVGPPRIKLQGSARHQEVSLNDILFTHTADRKTCASAHFSCSTLNWELL